MYGHRSGIAFVGFLLGLTVLASRSADASCPDSICDCLGAAGAYRVVSGGSTSLGAGTLRLDGYVEQYGALVENDVCTGTAKMVNPHGMDNIAEILGTLVATQGPGRPALGGRGQVDTQIITGGGSVPSF